MGAAPGQEGLVVLDGVQLVGGGVAALARQLPLGVVGPRAAGDVDVAPAEVAAALQGRRGGGDAVDDDARREEVGVLRQVRRKRNHAEQPSWVGPLALALALAGIPGR